MDGLLSPNASKTRLSMSHMKKSVYVKGFGRVNAMDQDGVGTLDEVKTANKVVLLSLTPFKEDKAGYSLRRALPPISSNMAPQKEQTADDGNCSFLMEPKTPMGSCNTVKVPVATPLDKFIALGSSMKESLVQQYLDFLNVANKQELQQLKGIGERRAEYILELREDSPRPFKSLSDLGSIGLSSKQVRDDVYMAVGLFSCRRNFHLPKSHVEREIWTRSFIGGLGFWDEACVDLVRFEATLL
ncbi:hypothetical protein GUJ93_ZPchr0010g9397 [Zizania palustris]|uniref:Kinesin motor domain-containing protein n=1 Tax=Zizania palustris TaxID=103762 RepID=A0A8J5W9X9_ZIZPA|nr:hypothetical protein GUJ93_ZPchr0010g9397 [Zizania palustris]